MSTPKWEADWGGYVRTLLYPVIFESDPSTAVDRAIDTVLADSPMTPTQFAGAVRAALASEAKLAEIIPETHPEDVVRAYLKLVEARLAALG